MSIERILIIDDKMYPGSPTQDKEAKKIKKLLKPYGFEVEFSRRGEDALEMMKEDIHKEIKLVFLDITFTEVETKMQGAEIFEKISDIRWEMPIVVITIEPVRKLTGKEDIFREFIIELGASLFIEKNYLSKRGEEQINYINALIRGQDINYILKYRFAVDHKKKDILIIDIVRKDNGKEFSILKTLYSISGDICTYVEECIDNFQNYVHWKQVNLDRKTNFSDIKFAKAVFKLNDALRRSSSGRIPKLIKCYGRVGCMLDTEKISEIEETQ